MALYEIVFIARPDMSAEDIDSLADKLSQIIVEYKGKIISKEYWGLRNLAYKINKNTRGHYLMINIHASYEAVKEFQRVASFNENILRNLVFSVDEHQAQSKLKISNNAKDYKDGKISEVVKSTADIEIEKIIINNLL